MVIEFNKDGDRYGRYFVQPQQTEGTTGKKVEKQDVPVGKPQETVENPQVGMDTFVRKTEANAADALAAYNRPAVKKSDNMPQVNTSPAATEARMNKQFARGFYPYAADEAGVPAMATVKRLDQALLAGLEENPTYAAFLNPQLAQYLNTADASRIEREMHIQEIAQYA